MEHRQVVALVISGVATYVITKWFNQKSQEFIPPPSRVDEPIVVLPRAGLFVSGLRSQQIVTWCFVAIVSIAVVATGVHGRTVASHIDPLLDSAGRVAMAAVFVFGAVMVLNIALCRCVFCRGFMLIRTVSKPPFYRPKMEWEALRSGNFHCCYCGQRYELSKQTA